MKLYAGPLWEKGRRMLDIVLAAVDRHIDMLEMIEEQERLDRIADAGAQWELNKVLGGTDLGWQSSARGGFRDDSTQAMNAQAAKMQDRKLRMNGALEQDSLDLYRSTAQTTGANAVGTKQQYSKPSSSSTFTHHHKDDDNYDDDYEDASHHQTRDDKRRNEDEDGSYLGNIRAAVVPGLAPSMARYVSSSLHHTKK